jgi:hypothetical protein
LSGEHLKALELTMYTLKYLNNFTQGKIEQVAEIRRINVGASGIELKADQQTTRFLYVI